MTQGYSTDNYTKWAEEFIRGDHGKKKGQSLLSLGLLRGQCTDRSLPQPVTSRNIRKQGYGYPDIYPPPDGKPKYSREKEQWI